MKKAIVKFQTKNSFSKFTDFAIAILTITAILSLFAFVGQSTAAESLIPSVPITGVPRVSGYVTSSIVTSDSSIYASGMFRSVGGTAASGGAFVDTQNGTTTPSIDANASVKAIAYDSNGGYYIGGQFTKISNTNKARIAHILNDGTLDPNFSAEVNNDVSDIVYDSLNNILYAAGKFTIANVGNSPVSRNKVAAFNGTSGVATGFNPDIDSDINSQVNDLEFDVTNQVLYIAGFFSSVNISTNPQNRTYIAGFNTSDSTVTPFDPDVSSNGTIYSMSLDPTNQVIYIIGSFSNVNISGANVARNKAAAIDIATSLATQFDPQISGNAPTRVLYIPDTSNVVISGEFDQVNSTANPTTRVDIAEFDGTTGAVTNFNANFDSDWNLTNISLNAANNSVIAVGIFYATGNGIPRTNFAEFDLTTGATTSLNPLVGSRTLYSVAVDPQSNRVFVGGDIYGINGTKRNNIAKIKSDGSLDTSFNPSVDGWPKSMLADEDTNTLYIAGDFKTVNIDDTPVARTGIVALDLMTGEIKDGFDAGINGEGQSLALDKANNTLYIGGRFSKVNTAGANLDKSSIAAVDASTGIVKSAFSADVVGSNNLEMADVGNLVFDSTNNILYTAGYFSNVNINGSSLTRNNVASFNGTTGLATNFNPSLDNSVMKLILSSDKQTITACGYFENVNTQTAPVARIGLAKFNVSDSIVTSFDAGLSNSCLNIEYDQANDNLYVGGIFQSINTNTTMLTRGGIAGINATTGVGNEFNPNVVGVMLSFSIDIQNSRFYAGGIFASDIQDISTFQGGLVGFGLPFEPINPQETTTTPTSTTTSEASTTTAPNVTTSTTLNTTTTKVSGSVLGTTTLPNFTGVKGEDSLPLTGNSPQTLLISALLILFLGLAVKTKSKRRILK